MSSHINRISIPLNDEEMKLLEEVWRGDFSVRSRSEFVRIAITEHMKRTICLAQRKGVANRLAE